MEGHMIKVAENVKDDWSPQLTQEELAINNMSPNGWKTKEIPTIIISRDKIAWVDPTKNLEKWKLSQRISELADRRRTDDKRWGLGGVGVEKGGVNQNQGVGAGKYLWAKGSGPRGGKNVSWW